MKQITSLIILLLAFNFGYGQIVAWSMNAPNTTGSEATLNARTLDPNLNMSTLRRGAGIDPDNLARTFSSDDYTNNGTQIDAVNNNDYFEFDVSAAPIYQVSLSTLDANFRRSNTGPNNFLWRYSLDGVNFTDIGSTFTYTDVGDGVFNTQAQIDLASIPALQNVVSGTTVTFRLYGWGSTNAGGSFAFGRQNGNELSIGGSVTLAPCSGGTVTWTAGAWSPNTGPNINTSVIINDAYNTAINGSFEACELTVSAMRTLTVGNGSYVRVQNDITVDGTLNILTSGAVVQVDDTATVTENGTISVSKTSAIANNWYEYTYWSSPVQNETIGSGLFESDENRRYMFLGQNYLDATRETDNDNGTAPGQDDVDDNGDDWLQIGGTTPMVPGVGYASMHDKLTFAATPGSPKSIQYIFNGPFNNGVITVPVYRNDSEMNDTNWNLIGNPYPSAINAQDFIAANPALEPTLYLWSHNTLPSATTNGNQLINFSNGDYAVINGITYTAGGDMLTPNGFIPSGQAFFVSMDNTAAATQVSGDIYTANVTFNNLMRDYGATDNSTFFKSASNSKKDASKNNRLWINLTSDNGVFSQIAIAYVDGATQMDDGTYYDTKRIITPDTYAALYSIIENNEDAYVIQAKNPSSLNEDEVIKLGLTTRIDVATQYKISISNLEGAFLKNNTIYLVDNLNNALHNLSDSDYTFTSDEGGFNNRFEIVFNTNALSTNAIVLEQNINIKQLDKNNVKFSSENAAFKSIEIFDILGRSLSVFDGHANSKTLNLSHLKTSVYIANIVLTNGTTVSKKFIKN